MKHRLIRPVYVSSVSILLAAALGGPALAVTTEPQPAAPTSPPPAPPQAIQPAPEDWKQAESSLLQSHLQLTSRDMFVKAGEAYFDHASPPRWIVFQAVPIPRPGSEPQPYYAMYVAKLKYDGTHITGIDQPIEISPPDSANTCGWFHPAEPWRILFGSTLAKPQHPEKSGYQRGSSRYIWQFPDEMEIVERSVSPIMLDVPREHPLRPEVDAYITLTDKHRELMAKARQSGDSKKMLQSSDDFRVELESRCPRLASARNFTEPAILFAQPKYDAECSYSRDGRFVLYARVKDGDESPKPDVDIYLYDTRTQRHHALVTAPGYDGGPFFSPDGKSICYRSDRAGNDLLQVFIAELKFDGDVPVGISREKQLTSNEHVNWGPYWHPSGSFLIYASSEMGHTNYELFAVESGPAAWDKSTDQVRRARVTHAPGADVLPVFSDDGKWMMWTCQRGPLAPAETKPSSQVWVAEFVPGASGSQAPSAFLGPQNIFQPQPNNPTEEK